MRYISEENLRQHIIIEGCDESCGYIDERGLESMEWEEIPERPKGKWVDGICNKCGYDGGVEAISGKANYCLICGADMREVSE